MDLKVYEEHFGEVEITSHLPLALAAYAREGTQCYVLIGRRVKALLQGYNGGGIMAWHSRYWIAEPVALHATSNEPFLELRIAWRNSITGTWEKIIDPELKESFFTISYAPYVDTRTFFALNQLYETFDIHIDVKTLAEFGVDYKELMEFVEKVLKGQPGNIGPAPYPCPQVMINAVWAIINVEYKGHLQEVMIESKIKEIIAIALQTIGTPEKILPRGIQSGDQEKIEGARQLIIASLPKYPGNKQICRKFMLNETKLDIGFKHYFGMSPSDYYLQQRLLMVKEWILRADKTIDEISDELGFKWPSDFSRMFKRFVGQTPTKFAEMWGKQLPRRRRNP